MRTTSSSVAPASSQRVRDLAQHLARLLGRVVSADDLAVGVERGRARDVDPVARADRGAEADRGGVGRGRGNAFGHGGEDAARLPRCGLVRSPQENMLAVLDALDVEPLTIRELAGRTGLPLASVHRIVVRLIAWGGLERVDGGVRPGLRLFELGQLVPARGGLRETALPFMGDLYAATHEVVSLAVLDGADTVWLEQLSGRLAPPVPSRVGGRLPAHVTAAGKVLLAFGPDIVAELRLERHGPGTITDPERAARGFARIRERGIAINREESRARRARRRRPGLRRDGSVVAALAIAVARRSESSPEAMAPAVRTAALSLGRTLRP